MSNLLQITTPTTQIGANGLSQEQAESLATTLAFLEQEIDPYVNLSDTSAAGTVHYFSMLLNAASQEPLLSTLRVQPPTGAYAPAELPNVLINVIRKELDTCFTPEVDQSDWFDGFEYFFDALANQGLISAGIAMQLGFANVRSVPHWIIGHQPQICFTLLLLEWITPETSAQQRMEVQAIAQMQRQALAFTGHSFAPYEQFLANSPRSFIVFAGATFGFTHSDWEKLGDRLTRFVSSESRNAIKIAPLG